MMKFAKLIRCESSAQPQETEGDWWRGSECRAR